MYIHVEIHRAIERIIDISCWPKAHPPFLTSSNHTHHNSFLYTLPSSPQVMIYFYISKPLLFADKNRFGLIIVFQKYI